MKRHLYLAVSFLFSFALLLLALFPKDAFTSESAFLDMSSVSILPIYLQEIDDEAFYGTNLQGVAFGDQLVHIGVRAFENIHNLIDIYIPRSTTYIGMNAFPAGTAIHGVKNSYALRWARANGYRYTYDDIWDSSIWKQFNHLEILIYILFAVIPLSEDAAQISRRIREVIFSMRPQDRPELYPIDYRFP